MTKEEEDERWKNNKVMILWRALGIALHLLYIAFAICLQNSWFNISNGLKDQNNGKPANNAYERGTKRQPFITDTALAVATINIRNRQFPISNEVYFPPFHSHFIWIRVCVLCRVSFFLISFHFLILCCFLFACASI